MSARYAPVGWNRTKIVYDVVVIGAVVLFLWAYLALSPSATALDRQSLEIRAWGACGFLLLTGTLAIGPLARLDPRLLPLLYNRRHLGVMVAAVATGHAAHALDWYFAYSPVPALEALLAADAAFGQRRGFPFIPFGIVALLILWVMAATSHDFWLSFLTPPVWKALHMGVYLAYALVVAHVAFGAMQDARDPALPLLVGGGAALLIGLHLAAARRPAAAPAPEGAWVFVANVDAIPEGGGVLAPLPGAEPAAVFRWRGRLSAMTNLCAHQNGPLCEGRVIDGLVTCPWHGFQYRIEDGCAPAPFTERLATHRLRLDGRRVLIDPRPEAPGARIEPLPIPDPHP